MSGSLDFTGQPIQETYKRVVQYDNGILYDGTGSLLGAINITGSQAVTASYALTASYLENIIPPFPFTGSAQITGSLGVTGSGRFTNDLYVDGTLFAQNQVIVTQSYYSGSNKFGDELSDIQQFTGSVQITGSLRVTGSINLSGSFTSSQDIQVNFLDIGRGASTVTNTFNVSIGKFNLESNTVGSTNVAVGYNSLPSNTEGNRNVAIGQGNMLANTTGNTNVAIGYESLRANTTGRRNIAIGLEAVAFNTTGESNIGIGQSALGFHKTGSFNVAMGDYSLADLQNSGSYNAGFGWYSGAGFISGSYNTFFGIETSLFQSGSNNVIIGGRFSPSIFGPFQIGSSISDSVVIGTNSGSIRLYSPSSTNILIGTTTDTGQKLQVSGSGRFTSDLTITGSLLVKGSQVISGSIQFTSPNDSLYSAGSNAFYRPSDIFNNTYAVNYIGGYYGDFTQFVFRNQVASDLVVINGSTGNMGVGNSSPTARLQVKGSGTTSATTALRVENSSNTTSLVVLDNGNVGIGTTSPDSPLDINGRVSIRGTNELYFGQSNNSISSWTTRMYASGSAHKFNAQTFIFNDEGYGGTEFMRITTSGITTFRNVGIGTSSPSSRLHIVGSGTTTSTDSLLVQNSSGTNLLQVTDGQVTTIGRKSTFTNGSTVLYVGNGPNNFSSGIVIDSANFDNVNYKVEILSNYFYGNPFSLKANNSDILYAFEGGSALQLPGVVTQGVIRANTLETLGYYHHIHSPFGSWPSGIKLTNPGTNTGSTDGVYMGLWTSAVDARLWNYETNGTWEIGVGNIKQVQVTTGSTTVYNALLGEVEALPTASGTASMDCLKGNFFTLTLSGSYTLHLSASNIQPGQTINLRITQPATSGSLSYGSQFKFAGGIPYTASSTGSAVDIISFVTFDSTNLYASAIKNLS